jgi:D-sedoheptulose 7-phosphate isomerase
VDFISQYFADTATIASQIDRDQIYRVVETLDQLRRENGRLFILGVGGSAANASHAVNDFRKLCNIESYAPTDNISEITARTNDEGWDSVFSGWLLTSKLSKSDCLMILSVGGGNLEKQISVNLCKAIDFAEEVRAKVISIVGREDGYAARKADIAIKIPIVNSETITAHSESFQQVIWHLLVSHPSLNKNKTKW